MPGLAIKNLPPQLHRRLKDAALRSRRSMARQVIVLLEQALEQEDRAAAGVPPEPIEPGVDHDSRWIYEAIRESRR